MNSALQRLDLRANPSLLGRSSSAMLTEMLTEMLGVNTTLTHLKLDGTLDACTSVAEALQRNSTLRHLELHEGGLGVAGWLALARMLRVNTTLRHLDLRGCDTIKDVFLDLAEGLAANTGLHYLGLDLFHAGAASRAALASALQDHTSLRKVTLTDFPNEAVNCGESGLAILLGSYNEEGEYRYG